MSHRIRLATFIAATTILLASCSTTYITRSADVPSSIELEEVAGAIHAAEQALLAGDAHAALDWMRVASELDGMPSDQRVKVQNLLEISADRFLADLDDDEAPPEALAEILDLDLPRQLAVTGAMRAVHLWVEREEYYEAYALIERIDKRFPAHHLRAEAGRLLVESGLGLSEMDSGWFDSTRDHAFACLEYCSINYPLTRRGDLVYRRLAEMYEEDQRWHFAIGRHEELTQNYPTSPLVPYSLARIPHLLLASIESPEYDRNALIQARKDLGSWLGSYPGHELTGQVREDLTDALVRLTISDLGIADFYQTVGVAEGARFHASRALSQARLAGDEKRTNKAQAVLDSLPAVVDAR
ncbi:MAG: hypothetical protein ACI8X5_001410 [Planctomycetota bacterium]|jgi:hypothetical protein